MEPSLFEGDWLWISSSTPQRDDLVVFREPGSGILAVKRVAGLPGDLVQLAQGDLFVNGKRYSRLVQSVADLVPMLDVAGPTIDKFFRLSANGFQLDEQQWWHLETSGLAFLRHPPMADMLLRGERIAGSLPAIDLGCAVDFQLQQSSAELELVLRKGSSTFHAHLFDGGSSLRVERVEEPESTRVVLVEKELMSARRQGQLFFTVTDDLLTLSLDEEPLFAPIAVEHPSPHALSEVPAELSHFEQVGVGGVGPLAIARLRLGRDILYQSDGTYAVSSGLQLAEHQYFLLGDHPEQSRDSRQYGAVSQDRLLGTVGGRLWPRGWSMRGWRDE